MSRFIKPLLPPDLADTYDLLTAALGDNPRQVKRFINTLLLNHALATAMMGKSYQPKLLVVLLIIQYRQIDLYRAVVLNPKLLQDIIVGNNITPEQKALYEKDVRLMEVIAKLKGLEFETAEPYIYLSEVAGVRTVGFDVLLKRAGPDKINVIRIIRFFVKGIGLKEIKDLVNSAPTLVAASLDRESAQDFVSQLQETGAEAEIH